MGHRYGRSWFLADLAACEAYLHDRHLTPACDQAVKALIIDRIIGLQNNQEVTDHLDVLDRVAILERADLVHVVWENPDSVWISCGTQFGLQIDQSPARHALQKGRLVGVAGVSALSGAYAGLFLYEWGSGRLGVKLKTFYGGGEISRAEGD
jgi:hypothetical protein